MALLGLGEDIELAALASFAQQIMQRRFNILGK